MDKQNVVHAHNGILFTLKREGSSGSYCSINGPWGPYTMWNKLVTKKTNSVWFLLDEVFRTVKFVEIESGRVVARGWGWGLNMESLFDGQGVLVCQDEKSCAGGWWWWCRNNVSVLNCTLTDKCYCVFFSITIKKKRRPPLFVEMLET